MQRTFWAVSFLTVGMQISVPARAAQTTLCLPDSHVAVLDAPEGSAIHRLGALLDSDNHKAYRAKLLQIQVDLEERIHRTSMFGPAQIDVLNRLEDKFELLLDDIAHFRVLPDEVEARVARVYKETFKESGTRVFVLEDDSESSEMLKRLFNKRKIPYAITDDTSLVRFWIDHMDRDNTALFFDADIYDEALVGAGFSGQAQRMGYRHIRMISGQDDKTLEEAGKPANIPNIIKPYTFESLLSVIPPAP